MNWIPLSTEESLQALLDKSAQTPQLIFKHSSRCSISSVVKSRLERKQPPAGMDFYFLDIIMYRELSNSVARQLKVTHESPQVLLVMNGRCVYHESHLGIRMDEIEAQCMVHDSSPKP